VARQKALEHNLHVALSTVLTVGYVSIFEITKEQILCCGVRFILSKREATKLISTNFMASWVLYM